MSAGIACLLEDGDRERLAAERFLHLRETKRGRQPSRATADYQHIDIESLAH
jgi:hypothetical protein